MNDAKTLTVLLKVLSVDTRVQILRLLQGRALCVNALAARLDVTQGAVSQHLRVMRDAGLVTADKRGCFVHYRLNDKTLAAWRGAIDRLLAPPGRAGTKTKGVSTCAAATTRRNKDARSRKT
jgi:DNA-binding transcriptional ArsR family regulator